MRILRPFHHAGEGVRRDVPLVVVLTGGNYATPELVNEIITRYILPVMG